MKGKPGFIRVPYRRGPDEEAGLRQLRDLRSAHVPRLGSDNLWLRFSIHLVNALWQVARGQANARLLFGDPAGAHELSALSSPDTELSTRLGEARLLATEAALLDQLRDAGEMATSRSAMLRQALMTTAGICSKVAEGVAVWIECDGVVHRLPDLLQLAAALGQPSEESIALCSHDVLSWPADARTRLGASGKADYCNPGDLFSKLKSGRYEVACFELELPELAITVRCALREGQPPIVEQAPKAGRRARTKARAPAPDATQIGRACPAPPGEWRDRGPSDALGVGEEAQCVLP